MYYKDLLRYRQIWLGIAMLWIIPFHVPVKMTFLWISESGYGGVDMCFFASGIGCFYSLTSDSDIGNFMKRRLKRIMPTYLTLISVWLMALWLVGNFDLHLAVGNLLALQHYSGNKGAFNWYVDATMLFYLLAPYFKTVIDRSSPVCKYLFAIFLFLCSVPFWKTGNYIIIASRLPIFYIGMLFADICLQSRQITKRHTLVAALSFLVGVLSLAASFKWFPGYLWAYGLYWYPFILITPPLCMAISYLMIHIENRKVAKPLVSFLSLCGNYSFEICLVQTLLLYVIPYVIRNLHLADYRAFVWAAGSIPLAVGCYLLRRITVFLTQSFQKLSSRVLA